MDSTPDPLPSFGRYETLFRIAAGGMAEVFAARIRGEAGFEKFVAIKRMLPHLAEDEHFVGMFLDEARLAVHVASPHVVQTLDLGRAEDGLYIAMELVVGCSLASLARELRTHGERVPLPIAIEILAQAAQGLDDAHEATTPTGVPLGIVHRDVSPHNLLISVDGRTRVSDFGIARAMLRRTSTATGELKGKFAYFSPEQAEGQQVDRRSDIFALGIVAWETILGRRLFGGSEMLQVLAMVRSHEIPTLDSLDPSIPPAVSQAVARALARPIDERYATAHDFAAALREAARAVGPAPSAREIGKWVAQTAPESVSRMRGQLDAAHASDDAATIARDGSGPHRAGSAGRQSPAAAPPASVPPGAGTNPSTLVASTLSSAPPGNNGRPAVVGALAAVAVIGAFLGARQLTSGDTKAAAPAESATASAAPSASSPPVVSAAVPAPSAEPATRATGRGRVAPAPTTRPGAPAATTTTPPAATAAPPATATATSAATSRPTSAGDAPKKGPTGPLLGDDAFK